MGTQSKRRVSAERTASDIGIGRPIGHSANIETTGGRWTSKVV